MAYNNNSEVFMPFGSGMNAYGQVNQGKGVEITQFLKDMELIFDKAKELVDLAHPTDETKGPTYVPPMRKNSEDDQLDLPVYSGEKIK